MKKQLLIASMALLAFAACGKKEETPAANPGNNNSSVTESANSNSSVNESAQDTPAPQAEKNLYFLTDSIYVPVEVSHSDSNHIVKFEYNDKGWLTKSYEKDTDYECLTELFYEENGNIVNVAIKEALYNPKYEPEDDSEKADPDGYYRSEYKHIIFNDDGTTDKFESADFGSLTVTERDYKGRAKQIRYSDPEYGDYSCEINYSAETMIIEEKDAENNSRGSIWYSNSHGIPVFATMVSDEYLPVPYYPGKAKTDSNGLIVEDSERGLKFAYDGSHRLVSVSEGEKIIASLNYDDNGKLTHQTDEHYGIETEYKYDENGNISEISIRYDDGNSETLKIKYEKVPLSMAGLCSFWLADNTLMPGLTDYDLLWNAPYMCFHR